MVNVCIAREPENVYMPSVQGGDPIAQHDSQALILFSKSACLVVP